MSTFHPMITTSPGSTNQVLALPLRNHSEVSTLTKGINSVLQRHFAIASLLRMLAS